MPKNPTIKQRLASANNLKGHYGPKTEEGKANSAKNGKKNKGAKTTKARARQIRNFIKDTYYDLSGCLDCVKKCNGRSFSKTAPYNEYAHGCLYEIVKSQPSQCFYYFHGLCGMRYTNTNIPDDYCIHDDPNLKPFEKSGLIDLWVDTKIKAGENRTTNVE